MPQIGGIIHNTLTNGEGVRMAIFFSGCPHKCEGCHNKHLWNEESGVKISCEDIDKEIIKNMPLIDGITLTGGDPVMQAEDATRIASYAKKNGLNVWLYTGYTRYQLEALQTRYEEIGELLKHVDIVVDGKFDQKLHSENIKHRGSTNQAIWKVENGKFVEDMTSYYDNK